MSGCVDQGSRECKCRSADDEGTTVDHEVAIARAQVWTDDDDDDNGNEDHDCDVDDHLW